jgi:excisionase family DNA binding protein
MRSLDQIFHYDPPVVLSTTEVAKELGCSTDTVRRLIASGRLPAFRTYGKGHLRVRFDDVVRLREEGRVRVA